MQLVSRNVWLWEKDCVNFLFITQKRRPTLRVLNDASWTSVTECQRTAVCWILTRQSFFGQVLRTASRCWVAGAGLCSWTRTQSWRQTMFMYGMTFSCDLSLDKHVSTVCAQSFFGFTNFDVCYGLWTMSPWREWSTLLSRPGWTFATRCSLVHRGLWRANCKESWMLQCASSATHVNTTVDCHSFYTSTSLARCVRSCQVQAQPDSPPVSKQQGAALPC